MMAQEYQEPLKCIFCFKDVLTDDGSQERLQQTEVSNMLTVKLHIFPSSSDTNTWPPSYSTS